jgi:hypothetical protein
MQSSTDHSVAPQPRVPTCDKAKNYREARTGYRDGLPTSVRFNIPLSAHLDAVRAFTTSLIEMPHLDKILAWN